LTFLLLLSIRLFAHCGNFGTNGKNKTAQHFLFYYYFFFFEVAEIPMNESIDDGTVDNHQ